MKEDVFYSKLEKLPRLHPSHPYEVTLYEFRRSGPLGKHVQTVYVRSASPQRAKLAAYYWFHVVNKRKQKVHPGVPRPEMPINLNQYWDYKNNSNPEGLMLSGSGYDLKVQTKIDISKKQPRPKNETNRI